MKKRVCSSGSYEEALGIIGEYVNITSEDGQEFEDMEVEEEKECQEPQKEWRVR